MPETHLVAQTDLKAGGTSSPAAMTTHDTRPVPLSAGGRVPERLPEARVLLLCPGPADRSRAGAPADPHQRGGCPAAPGEEPEGTKR